MAIEVYVLSQCPSCDLAFFSLTNRETHVRKAHLPPEETQYRCARCDMNFVTHKEFSLHKRGLHGTGEARLKFICRLPGCTFEFNKREELAYHVKAAVINSVL